MTDTLRPIINDTVYNHIDIVEGTAFIDGDTQALIDAIHTAVQAHLTKHINTAIEQALAAPETIKSITVDIIAPILTELEDAIDDDHDHPKTPDLYRAGLRRASRTIRNARRDLLKDAT